MEIDGFWLLVEQSRGSDAERAQALTDSLTSLGKDEIVDFENHLNRSVSQLMSFDHLAAHFMIQSYTEPPRESRRLVGVSHAAMASSRCC